MKFKNFGFGPGDANIPLNFRRDIVARRRKDFASFSAFLLN